MIGHQGEQFAAASDGALTALVERGIERLGASSEEMVGLLQQMPEATEDSMTRVSDQILQLRSENEVAELRLYRAVHEFLNYTRANSDAVKAEFLARQNKAHDTNDRIGMAAFAALNEACEIQLRQYQIMELSTRVDDET